MSSFVAGTLLAAASVLNLPTPEHAFMAAGAKSPNPTIYEWSDYGGRASTFKARLTPDDAERWCDAWYIDGEELQEKRCAYDLLVSEQDKTYTVTANCHTGEIWTAYGKKYLFDGAYEGGFFNGFVAVKDTQTGQRVPDSNASGAIETGINWLTLCPLGLPYDQLPVQKVFTPGPTYEHIGSYIGHNGSSAFLDQKGHTIRYGTVKPSLVGVVESDTVLFRGWIVWGERAVGIAYTFKKGCASAPYHVIGEFPRAPQLILKGKAPVREGCKVVGYTEKSKNARLVFDLPLD